MKGLVISMCVKKDAGSCDSGAVSTEQMKKTNRLKGVMVP